MKLLNNEELLWDKEIDVKLTLRELQELYCALGTTNCSETEYEWNELSNCQICPFDVDKMDSLYKDLERILIKQGGFVYG